MSQKTIIKTVNQIASHAKLNGIAHLDTQDDTLTRNILTIDGKSCVNFGSCSYLGLEFEESIREAAKQAIDSYGTQFSSSRAYISPRYYGELEEKLSRIFEAHAIVTPTTTLGHIAAIPTLVSQDDALILDHQVHNSVQTAASIMKSKGTHIELLRHNRMDLLQKRIEELKNKYENIWYMADGIYSMFGDAAPIDEIYALMDQYPQFRFYVDDAHGMSCYGKNGRGFVLANRKIHKQMVLATSFAKAFATGGGALVFPDQETAQLVRNCGGPLITSGPMQPSALGAACAVADLHLNGKIESYQEDLQQNILYTNLLLKKHNLPNLAEKFSPIFFIAVSLPKIAHKLINRLKAEGYFLNIGIFPAVPIKNTGVRFTITRLHTFEQIENMVQAMARHYDAILKEEEVTRSEIYKAFKMKPLAEANMENKVESLIKHSYLRVEHTSSIKSVAQKEWDNLLGENGTFDWQSLNLLENSFTNNAKPYQNWKFDYLIVKDCTNKVVLATFMTTALSKDDMLMQEEVSREIEEKRLSDPDYMTSTTLLMGSPLTEGNHLYLDRKSTYWREALNILLEKIDRIQEKNGATNVMLRDLPSTDHTFDEYMLDNGHFKIAMPDNYKLDISGWDDEKSYFEQLSRNGKRHYRKNITRYQENFELRIHATCSPEETETFYKLYANVKNNSLALNTFLLPKKLFKNMVADKNWEILSLYLKTDIDSREIRKPVAMAICHKGKTNYTFVIAGIDYEFNAQYNCYRQLLAKLVMRGKELGYKAVHLGYTSDVEKKRFGAVAIKSSGYMQAKDNYSMEAMGTMTASKKRQDGVNKGRVLSV